jgi:hypothetical protein
MARPDAALSIAAFACALRRKIVVDKPRCRTKPEMSAETAIEMTENNNITSAPSEAGFLDETQLLRRIPVSRRTLSNWKSRGAIPFCKLAGGRRCLYHWPTIEAALLRHQRGALP